MISYEVQGKHTVIFSAHSNTCLFFWGRVEMFRNFSRSVYLCFQQFIWEMKLFSLDPDEGHADRGSRKFKSMACAASINPIKVPWKKNPENPLTFLTERDLLSFSALCALCSRLPYMTDLDFTWNKSAQNRCRAEQSTKLAKHHGHHPASVASGLSTGMPDTKKGRNPEPTWDPHRSEGLKFVFSILCFSDLKVANSPKSLNANDADICERIPFLGHKQPGNHHDMKNLQVATRNQPSPSSRPVRRLPHGATALGNKSSRPSFDGHGKHCPTDSPKQRKSNKMLMQSTQNWAFCMHWIAFTWSSQHGEFHHWVVWTKWQERLNKPRDNHDYYCTIAEVLQIHTQN